MRELTDLELQDITGGDLQPINTPFPDDDGEGDGDNGDTLIPLLPGTKDGSTGGGVPVIIHWNPDHE